jgi:hypothetical protein
MVANQILSSYHLMCPDFTSLYWSLESEKISIQHKIFFNLFYTLSYPAKQYEGFISFDAIITRSFGKNYYKCLFQPLFGILEFRKYLIGF